MITASYLYRQRKREKKVTRKEDGTRKKKFPLVYSNNLRSTTTKISFSHPPAVAALIVAAPSKNPSRSYSSLNTPLNFLRSLQLVIPAAFRSSLSAASFALSSCWYTPAVVDILSMAVPDDVVSVRMTRYTSLFAAFRPDCEPLRTTLTMKSTSPVLRNVSRHHPAKTSEIPTRH